MLKKKGFFFRVVLKIYYALDASIARVVRRQVLLIRCT